MRRGNWGEVGEDVGQIQYAVIEAVIGAERLAQIAARSTQVLNRIKFATSGIVRVGRRVENVVDDVPGNAPNPRRIAAGATNAEKGVFGEAMSDEWMANRGFQKMNGDLVQIGDRPIGNGIDGVWRNSTPPPEYIITESKFGSSRLGMTRDGQQMSQPWIERRLERAVGSRRAADEIVSSGYERWLLNIDENGNVTRTIMR